MPHPGNLRLGRILIDRLRIGRLDRSGFLFLRSFGFLVTSRLRLGSSFRLVRFGLLRLVVRFGLLWFVLLGLLLLGLLCLGFWWILVALCCRLRLLFLLALVLFAAVKASQFFLFY